MHPSELKICIIGLGYVGLPLAVEFAKKYPTIGYDINPKRVDNLNNGIDNTGELAEGFLDGIEDLKFTSSARDIGTANFFIVTVPTPVDSHKQPDLNPLLSASNTIGTVLKKGDFVIYESTVYPGATEEECVPILEASSGLKLNHDFWVGYSPERINPGDRGRPISSIKKITSGSNFHAAKVIDDLYNSIINAGTFMAQSIRVAEAAKVVENTQRDLNIALMNELAIIFNRLGIDTEEVLEAAGTKWNFIPFRPGLVGGHCIGVDPYYLTHKGQAIGCYPEIILAGRRLNDGMGAYISSQLCKLMITHNLKVKNAKILLMGLAFKENCPDIRNTRVVDIFAELGEYGCSLDVYDPLVKPEEAMEEYGISLIQNPMLNSYDAIVLLVPHNSFVQMGANNIRLFGKRGHVFYDVKSVFPKKESEMRL